MRPEAGCPCLFLRTLREVRVAEPSRRGKTPLWFSMPKSTRAHHSEHLFESRNFLFLPTHAGVKISMLVDGTVQAIVTAASFKDVTTKLEGQTEGCIHNCS